MMKKKLHLVWFGEMGPAEWRNSPSYPLYNHAGYEIYQDIARMCERAKFDMIMFADSGYVSTALGGNADVNLKKAIHISHDPLLGLAMMAPVTKHVGLGCTLSTSFYPPYLLARKAATLDHLSGGRMAWNIVTSVHGGNHYGIKLLEHDERYAMADEYLQVVKMLWESWGEDAVVLDRKNRIFADPSKIRTERFKGKYFDVEGPLTVDRSPQGHPVLINAGASRAGQAFALKHAEMVINHLHTREGMKKYCAKVRSDLVAAGRDPDSMKIFLSIKPVMAETETLAKMKQAERFETADVDEGLAYLSQNLALDMSKLPLDKPIPSDLVATTSKLQAMRGLGSKTTLRDHCRLEALRETYEIVGSYEQVADELEETAREVGCDGFHFRCAFHDYGYLTEVCTRLVPILQERGLFRTEYEGSTLRENLFAY